MKIYIFSILATFCAILNCTISFAQAGAVYTVAGGGTSIADGIPATAASISIACGMGVDAAGNVYVMDDGNYKIRKIDVATGIITTVAGTGVNGYTGDGGPAISAQIGESRSIFVDNPGNIYLADHAHNVIRKVDASTGIITTISGHGSSSADGIPATSANIGEQLCVFVDAAGNIYHSGANNSVRKVNAATGIITTIAGGGSSLADGIPATNAMISSGVKSISLDASGNLYIISHDGYPIRKVDGTTGIITTIAGKGSSAADGIPASSSSLSDAHNCRVDALGNVFVADWSGSKVRRIDATTGLITTIAGGGSSSAEGASALSAVVQPYQLCLDPVHCNIYVANYGGGSLRKFSFTPLYGGSSGSAADSFRININRLCNGPELVVVPYHYTSGMSVKTDFGDGTTDVSPVIPGYLSGGYAKVTHTYSASGTYSITQVLFNGTAAIDTLTNSYAYSFCRSFPVKLFYDANLNCIKDGAEPFAIRPSVIRVDSNGVNIGTVSATSGFDYSAYGAPGDVYSFRLLSTGGDMVATCPASGVLTNTVSASTVSAPAGYFGLACVSASTFDLSVNAVIPVTGVRDQWGNIYVRNNSCIPSNADVTLNFSPKYSYTHGASPTPASTTASSITWHLTGLSGDDVAPHNLYYAIWNNPSTGLVPIGDTVRSYITVTPTGGDAHPIDNYENILDTVRSGCDPNEIFVSPAGCLLGGAAVNQLQYTIHFENTGNDTAHNIYVMDTLSDFVDPSTMRIINSSAEMYVSQPRYAYNHNIFRFDFPNINLLDSSHHNECNGSVIFTINTKPGLADGLRVDNHAGIFFDYNEVVMTNTVVNTIGCPAPASVHPIDKPHVLVYPNPANDKLTIKMDKGAYQSFAITNSIGQQFIQQELVNAQTEVDIKALPAGLYYLSLRGEKGAKAERFVKE